MKKLYFLFFTTLTFAFSFGQVVINEIDADTPGTDMAEFIELKGTPNASLDGFVVVLYNGSNDESYAAFDLDGKTLDANGFFILGNTSIISGQDIDLGASNGLQNGADAVAIYTGNDTDFPNNTPVTSTNLIDALVYGTGDADDMGLLTGLGETVQYDESLNSASASESLQLNMAETAYETKAPTFRQDNNAAVCELSLTTTSATCDAFTSGTDTYTATVDFSGGGTSTYTVTATSGSVDLSGGDPTTDATGTITVTGVSEGTDVTIDVVDGGLCTLMSTVTSPVCEPSLTLPITETFDYSDGSLTSNPNWSTHSGNAGDLLVTSGQAVVEHGTPSEDANIEFTPISGNIYFSFEFSVDDLGAPYSNAGTDFEYFAHFNSNPNPFVAKLDIVPPSGGGDFSVGIGSLSSTADATWATDLTYGTTYHVIVRFNQDENLAELWIDATSDTDPSILGADEAGTTTVSSFALRQSDSDENETIRVDNLRIADNFARATLSDESFEIANFSLYPNPTSTGQVNINSVNSGAMDVAVYDILGKQVKRETITNTLDVSNLRSGVYILKITQNEATTTKKLVIR